MSASPVFTSAALGRPFIFSVPLFPAALRPGIETSVHATKTAEILSRIGALSKRATVVPASRLDVRPLPEMVSSGIPQLDLLTGGFPRGCLTEICGAASSGRTSVLLSALARATERGEVCALVDASDAFDPASGAAAGVKMNRLLWVRCGEKFSSRNNKDYAAVRKPGSAKTDAYPSMQDTPDSDSSQGIPSGIPQVAEKKFGFNRWQRQLGQMLKVTDLLLQSNGFGMIALDLGDIPMQSARRIPLASWFRFRRAVENTSTALLVLEQQPIAGSCSSLLLKVSGRRSRVSENKLLAFNSERSENRQAPLELPHSELLDQLEITAELLCSRLGKKWERKPVQSMRASFKSHAAWAG
jgi:recombination protein RecA